MATSLKTKTIEPEYAFLKKLDVGLDVLILGAWVLISFFYTFIIGRRRGPVLVLSTYAGLAVANIAAKMALPFSSSLGELQQGEFFALGVFAFITLLAFVALLRVVRTRVRGPITKQGAIILGALETGAFLASIGSLLPGEMKEQITGIASVLFATPWTLTLWLILPLIMFLVSERRKSAMLDNV